MDALIAHIHLHGFVLGLGDCLFPGREQVGEPHAADFQGFQYLCMTGTCGNHFRGATANIQIHAQVCAFLKIVGDAAPDKAGFLPAGNDHHVYAGFFPDFCQEGFAVGSIADSGSRYGRIVLDTVAFAHGRKGAQGIHGPAHGLRLKLMGHHGALAKTDHVLCLIEHAHGSAWRNAGH